MEPPGGASSPDGAGLAIEGVRDDEGEGARHEQAKDERQFIEAELMKKQLGLHKKVQDRFTRPVSRVNTCYVA